MAQLKPLSSVEEISNAEKLIKELKYIEFQNTNPLLGEICDELEVDQDATYAISSFYQYLFIWCRRSWGDLSVEDLRIFFGSWLATAEPNLSRNQFHKYWQIVKHLLNALARRGKVSPAQVSNLTRAIYDWRQVHARYHAALENIATGIFPEIFLQAPLLPANMDCSSLAQQTYKDWVCLFTACMYRPVFWLYWYNRVLLLRTPRVSFLPTLFLTHWDVEFSGMIRVVSYAFQEAGYQERGILNASALRRALRQDRWWISNYLDKTCAGNIEGGESLLVECIHRIVKFFIGTPARFCQKCPAQCFHQGPNPCPFFQQMNPEFFCQKIPKGWELQLPPIQFDGR